MSKTHLGNSEFRLGIDKHFAITLAKLLTLSPVQLQVTVTTIRVHITLLQTTVCLFAHVYFVYDFILNKILLFSMSQNFIYEACKQPTLLQTTGKHK